MKKIVLIKRDMNGIFNCINRITDYKNLFKDNKEMYIKYKTNTLLEYEKLVAKSKYKTFTQVVEYILNNKEYNFYHDYGHYPWLTNILEELQIEYNY